MPVLGFSDPFTKVNRCLTEGRRSFLARVAGIEAGAECERLAPALSALADGEAVAAEMSALRRHLRGCLRCRAALREYRAAPARVAALVPPVTAAGGTDGPGLLGRALEWAAAPLQARGGALAERAHAVSEMASAQKVAAIAASTAALAGGGVATVKSVEDESRSRRERESRPERADRPLPPRRIAAPVLDRAERQAERRRAPQIDDDARRRAAQAREAARAQPAQQEFGPRGSSPAPARATPRGSDARPPPSGGQGAAAEFAP